MISPYVFPGMFRLREKPEPAKEPAKPEAVSPREIIQIVCDYYGVEPETLSEKWRYREVVKARFVCWHLMRLHQPTMTLREAGAYFGRFDHTTVINGCKQIRNAIEVDQLGIRHELKQIGTMIASHIEKLKA